MYSHHSDKGTNTATAPKFKLNDTLVEVDGWRLVRPIYPGLLGVESYIIHIACKREEPRSVQSVGAHADGVDMGTGARGVCTWCGKTPPPEIAGLEILHNGKI